MKKNIQEFTLEELEKVMASWGQPGFRAAQVFSWIYQKKAGDFDSMSNLPLELRGKLKAGFSLFDLEPAAAQESRDGTMKFLFKLPDAEFIEAVSIPVEGRLTGCISSQAGCKFACGFCASGLRGFKRNLTRAEIIEEVLYLKNASVNPLTHIVFMGTGEPLDNYDNVLAAVRTINSEWAFNIGARRITISTCGIIPGIRRLSGEGLQIELSVSLHGADDRTRDKLMPVNRTYPLKELLAALSEYVRKTDRQVTFEYILIKGINSDLQSAKRLGKLLMGLNCKVNLIPLNPREGLKLEPPSRPEILDFRETLTNAGIPVTLRRARGQDIDAACGQLRLRNEKA